MATVLYSAAASLDGFIAGPGGDMSWLSEFVGDPDPTAERLLAGTGAILCGHRTFGGDDPNAGTDAEGAFGGRWEGPSIVLTHHPPATSEDPSVTWCTDLDDAVRAAKAAAGGRYVNVLGADVARQCLHAGVLDEILVFIAPVLLGDGVRLFEHPGGTNVALEPMPGRQAGPNGLWLRVR